MKEIFLKTALFKSLSESENAFLNEESTRKAFKKGELIFKKGTPAQTLFLVLSGKVKLFNILSGSQKEEIVCLINPGGYFCLAPLLSRELLHINAKALEDCETIMIPRAAIEQLIERSHAFSKNIIRALAGKECDLCEQVCGLALTSPKERLAKYLLEQSQLSGKTSLKLTASQGQLASQLGTVREHLSRQLAALKKAKLIRSNSDGTIEILDPLEIKNIAERRPGGSLPIL